MTKLQNNTHNIRNMPVTTPDIVSIYPFSKKLKMELLVFIDQESQANYINDDAFDEGVHLVVEVVTEGCNSDVGSSGGYSCGMLRIPVDDYEPIVTITEYLHEIGQFGKVCNKLLKFDWGLPDDVFINKITLCSFGTMSTKLGSVIRQFVFTPSVVGGAV